MEASREEFLEKLEWDHRHMETLPDSLEAYAPHLRHLSLRHNELTALPPWITRFTQLEFLDLSNNALQFLPSELFELRSLKTLLLRNNLLDDSSIPKANWGALVESLETLNLSGNQLETLPESLGELRHLRWLSLGGNRLVRVSSCVQSLSRLEVLYLGGNVLREVPAELGRLSNLTALVLSDNRLESLPSSLGQLSGLRSLSLHGNRLQKLPQEILMLRNLEELSLRNNPLVVRFIRDMDWAVPSLMELCGRAIRLERLNYSVGLLPRRIVEYLDSGNECVNPKCKGVFFTSRVDHIKFVDFCGKYRVPLQQYLCSPNCSSPQDLRRCSSTDTDTASDDNGTEDPAIIQRVLLG